MKGRTRKPVHSVYRSRDLGPRELQRRYMENLYAKADVGGKKPRPLASPDNAGKRRRAPEQLTGLLL